MTLSPLVRASLQPRIDGIQNNILTLQEFATHSLEDFKKPETLDRVHYHLRLALEGVFNITSHILSRFPGARETEYKKMAKKLGDLGIVDAAFAEETLVKMAGYRNRLTHFYAQVQVEELFQICRENLVDIEKFLAYVKELLKNPEKFNLTLQ